MLADARRQRRSAWASTCRPSGRRRRAPAVRGRELRPRVRPRGAPPHPRPRRARSASSSACSRRAARSCSRASPRATATASPACPSASRRRLAPLWRRAIGARPAPPAGTASAPDAALEGVVDVHAFAPGRACRGPPARRASNGRRVERRGAAGQLVRLDQPHARGDRPARRRAVGVAPVRLPRLPAPAGGGPEAARVPAAGGDLLQPDDLRQQARRRPLRVPQRLPLRSACHEGLAPRIAASRAPSLA